MFSQYVLAPLANTAVRHSLAAVVALALSAGPIGVFLMLRRMSLIGDAMSHAILPGVAIGFLAAGLNVYAMTLGGLAAGLLIAVLAGMVSRATALQEDTSLAVFLLISLALGVVLVTVAGIDIERLMTFLFGETAAKMNLDKLVVIAVNATISLIAMALNPIFDPSMNAQQQAAVNYAIGEYEHLYTNNTTLNISFQMGVTGLGESNSTVEGSFTYAQIKAALAAEALAHPGDAIKQTVVANLPASNPAPTNNYWLTTADAKALGLDNYGGTDGFVTFSNAVTYTYDPHNRGVAGEYDFIGVAEHEIAEVMGRIPGLGSDYGNGASYDLNDLYRFTNGVRNFTVNQSDPPGVYLSIDNGVTNTVNFYSQGIDNDDYRGDNPTDPYNQFAGQGQAHALTNADMINMDALGYNLAQATPEPASLTLLATGCFAFGGLRVVRRRRRAVA